MRCRDSAEDSTCTTKNTSFKVSVECITHWYEISYLWYYHGDRKSVVQGKSVDLGGRRIIKKKKKRTKKNTKPKQTKTNKK